MDNKGKMISYYGSEDTELLSYLEFGSIDIKNAKKTVWGYWQHQEAYDLYMFARYARDLFLFRDFYYEKQKSILKLREYINRTAHDKIIDYVFKYVGFLTLLSNENLEKSVCESGSSLFGLIEEVIATDYVFSEGKNIEKIKKLKYLGSDISKMMNRGAKEFHPDIKFAFSMADTIDKLMDEYQRIGLFYGLSISLRYALRQAKDIQKIAENSDIVIFNRISLSYEKTLKIEAGTGKYAYIISIDELKECLRSGGMYAKFTTDNMQKNKDGDNTIRVSMIITKHENLFNDFIKFYDDCVEKLIEEKIEGIEHGEWKDIEEL